MLLRQTTSLTHILNASIQLQCVTVDFLVHVCTAEWVSSVFWVSCGANCLDCCLQGLLWRWRQYILPKHWTPPICPHGVTNRKVKFKLFCDQRSVGQFVLVSGTHLGPMTRFSLLSDIRDLNVVGCPRWWEDGSVLYLYNVLSLFGHSPVELMTTSYCLIRTSEFPLMTCRATVEVF
jgi:hypothetical protein